MSQCGDNIYHAAWYHKMYNPALVHHDGIFCIHKTGANDSDISMKLTPFHSLSSLLSNQPNSIYLALLLLCLNLLAMLFVRSTGAHCWPWENSVDQLENKEYNQNI